MIQRYEIDGFTGVKENPDGGWVRWEDVERVFTAGYIAGYDYAVSGKISITKLWEDYYKEQAD